MSAVSSRLASFRRWGVNNSRSHRVEMINESLDAALNYTSQTPPNLRMAVEKLIEVVDLLAEECR